MGVRMILIGTVLILITKAYAAPPPRLADGHVDLQGIWNLSNLTPLERQESTDPLVIEPVRARQIEARIDALRNNQPTGGQPAQFDEERRVERVRGQLRSSIIVEPSDGRIPGNELFKEKLSEARAAAIDGADGPEQRPPLERCISSAAATAPMHSVPTLNLHQVVQTRDAVLIYAESNRDARIVRLNAQHVSPQIVSVLGDSIGWWDRDTLVVETTQFSPSIPLRTAPLLAYFVSPRTVVTERFTRRSSDELLYEFTIDDPTYYTREWRGENELRRSAGPIFEFACHEGNYALTHVLQGARAREAKPVVP
jgi:hypothetical protein